MSNRPRPPASQRQPADEASPPGRARPSRRLSPYEKKALSYERDRRNSYGESDKGSRKAIPFHKRSVNQANRVRDKQFLRGAEGAHDPELAERAEDQVKGRRRHSWRKFPDESLRESLARRRARR